MTVRHPGTGRALSKRTAKCPHLTQNTNKSKNKNKSEDEERARLLGHEQVSVRGGHLLTVGPERSLVQDKRLGRIALAVV